MNLPGTQSNQKINLQRFLNSTGEKNLCRFFIVTTIIPGKFIARLTNGAIFQIASFNKPLAMSFTKLVYHIVFSPKGRTAVISQSIEREFYTMLYKILRRYNAFVHRIGGMPDHVHLLVEIPPMASLSKFIQSIKRESSTAAASMIPNWPGWQEGYGAFTCGYREIETTEAYIANQKSHHAVVPFRQEYRQWLIENGISPDEPYFPK